MNRRTFLKQSITGALLVSTFPSAAYGKLNSSYPVIQITDGQKQHWFGYYDKWQVDPTGRYALGCEVNLFFRSPTINDTLRVGLIDMQNDNQWTQIGTSRSWGWQQGCMLQWIPGSTEEFIWNDLTEEGYVSRIYNIRTRKTRTLPQPIYTLSPDGTFALTVDFDRLQFFRPGYGYPAINPAETYPKAPEDTGIYKMDLQSGESDLIISYRQLANLNRPNGSVADYYHWFNHLLINPRGDRFIFLNRSRPVDSIEAMEEYLETHPDFGKGKFNHRYVTRAITANTDGSEIYPLNDSGQFSHFIWKRDDVITAWAVPEGKDLAAFYEFKDKSKDYKQIGAEKMPQNGHNTYVPKTDYEWILNDTYAHNDPDRMQSLYLYHVPTNRKVILGEFHEPDEFSGEWRCDLHPRCDQQGKNVLFDSTHKGRRRQMYKINIEEIVHS